MSEELVGLIPAAGKGIRLGLPYPKELYPIIRENRYKPVSQFVVENLTASGVEHVVFVINDTKHQLIGYFGSGRRFGCNFSYVVQEPKEALNASSSPGLADALNSAYHLIRGKTVCFGMADTIMAPKEVFRIALEQSRPTDDAVLGLFTTTRPEKFGMVHLDADNRVMRIDDKPKSTTLKYMWGFIVWRPAFTEHLNACVDGQAISDFAQIMNLAIEKGLSFRGVILPQGSYSDLGTYDEILELERLHRAE
jgi:glucose-1-phosphate thymidylyltransferase